MKKTKKNKKLYIISGIAITGVAAAIAVPIIILKNNQDNSEGENGSGTNQRIISRDAIIGENTRKIGDGTGKTYTKAQIDARDADGTLPSKTNADNGTSKVGLNSKKIDGSGDGSGNDYTQAQIDHAKGGEFVAPNKAVEGINNPQTGDGTGKTYTQAQIDARETDGPFPSKTNADNGTSKVGLNKKEIPAVGDGSGNTYTQAQIDKAKGGEFVAPGTAVEGINNPQTGDGTGKTYTKAQIDARDADGTLPSNADAINGKAQVGLNKKEVPAVGDGSGKTYAQAQIDKAKGGEFVAPGTAVEGINNPQTGDGTGKTYTQAQIDARETGGPFPSKEDASFDNIKANIKNSKKIDGSGDGTGNTYTQAQIDKVKGGEFVAPARAVAGLNKESGVGETLSDKNIELIYKAIIFIKSKGVVMGIHRMYQSMYANKEEFKKYMNGNWSLSNNFKRITIEDKLNGFIPWNNLKLKQNIYNEINQKSAEYGFKLELNQADPMTRSKFTFTWIPDEAIGLGNNINYTQAQIDARDADGTFPSNADAINGKAQVGLNKKEVPAVGDGSGKTYTKAQIDKAKGGEFVAPGTAVEGINNPKTGDGTGKTYTKAQIDARETGGPFPSKEDASFDNIKANIKNSKKIDGSGDGTGNTYTQAQIDKAKGGEFVAPNKAVEGINNPQTGDGTGKTYTKAQIDARDADGTLPSKTNADNGTSKVGLNSKKIDGSGDGSGKTYAQAQIDKAKGGEFVAPGTAVEGINNPQTGDGTGKTYTQAQIDARETDGPFPSSADAINGKAQVGLNKKEVPAVGDGTGNTYTQAQIDKAKGGEFVAPPDAVEGINYKATGDGSGETYTDEEIDRRTKQASPKDLYI